MAIGKKTGGRVAGTPNRTTMGAKASILETFRQLGSTEHMVEWARANPSDFYRLFAKLVPTPVEVSGELEHTHTHTVAISELDRRLEGLLGGREDSPSQAVVTH